MEDLFGTLEDHGVARDDLFLAWDFTVASERNLSERMLHIRDDAFASLDGEAPAVHGHPGRGRRRRARRPPGHGHVHRPELPDRRRRPGQPVHRRPERPPGTQRRPHRAVPLHHLALDAAARRHRRTRDRAGGLRARAARQRARGRAPATSATMANEHDFVFCATKWAGMSEDDVANAVSVLQDLSRFPTIADRLQQGILEHAVPRAPHRSTRTASCPTPRSRAPTARPSSTARELFYDGNSQGGIMGGAATAVAQDWTRAVLGVPGDELQRRCCSAASTGTRTRRSSSPPTPTRIDRTLAHLDRPDAVGPGRGQRVRPAPDRDPYPNTPKHTVLLARRVRRPPGRQRRRRGRGPHHRRAGRTGRRSPPAAVPTTPPLWGIPAIGRDPYGGSAIVYWDSGVAAPPVGNLAAARRARTRTRPCAPTPSHATRRPASSARTASSSTSAPVPPAPPRPSD